MRKYIFLSIEKTIMSDELDNIESMDPRLAIMMQWLKDNDESGIQANEHRNKPNVYVSDIIEGTDCDS